MIRKFLSILLILLISISGFATAEAQKYRYEFFDTFDTLIAIIAYTNDKELFDSEMKKVKEIFTHYHQLFDIYNEYEGINNLATVNKSAFQKSVKVDKELFNFLVYVKDLQNDLNTPANIALGRVLNLWNDARKATESNPQNSYIPELSQLKAASEHSSIDSLILDENTLSVKFTDDIQLDVGSVAKGYACEKAAQYLLISKIPNFIINAGGNIRTGHKPLDERVYWGVGIADPFKTHEMSGDIYDVVFINDSSLVTSGDYQRFFICNGKKYHHIIDPSTLFPANYFKSVSIYTENSALADYLSTSVFCLSLEQGMKLINSIDGVEAMWILNDGSSVATDGFKTIQKSQGASSLKSRDWDFC